MMIRGSIFTAYKCTQTYDFWMCLPECDSLKSTSGRVLLHFAVPVSLQGGKKETQNNYKQKTCSLLRRLWPEGRKKASRAGRDYHIWVRTEKNRVKRLLESRGEEVKARNEKKVFFFLFIARSSGVASKRRSTEKNGRAKGKEKEKKITKAN